ncbi:MAG: hypothetical protein AAGI17_01570 [Planctomycetota bacterium]
MPTAPIRRLAAAALCFISAVAAAQQGLGVLPTLPPAPAIEYSGQTLDLEGTTADVRVTQGATAITRTTPVGLVAQITLPDRIGVVTVEPRVEAGEISEQSVVSALVRQTLGLQRVTGIIELDRPLVTEAGELIGPGSPLPVGSSTLRPYYLRRFGPQEGSTDLIQGVTLVKMPSGPNETRVLVCRLVAQDSAFDIARAHYESILRGLLIEDTSTINRSRAEALRAGTAALALFRSGVLRDHVETRTDTWERLYRPAGPNGRVQEAGYRRVRAYPGVRGDARNIPADQRGPADEQRGYVVKLDARLLADPARGPEGGLVDSRAVYFLSEDSTEELWTANNAIRLPEQEPDAWIEVGGRSGDTMTISVTRGSASPVYVRPKIQGEGYASRVESFLLPELIHAAGLSGVHGFYSYDQSAETIRLRTDTITRSEDGAMTIKTVRAGGAEQVTQLDAQGRVTQTVLASGLVWEAITLDELLALWREKGLPVE